VATYVVIAAHPDDPDFGVAGTAAALAKDGHAVHYVMCTSGDAGSDDPGISAEALVRTREDEQVAAGRILGLAGVHFLRFPDGELVPSIDLRKALVRAMRRLKADVVLCQDPRPIVDDDGNYLNHPDHRAAGQAAVDAAFPAAGNPSAFRDLLAEGLEAHKVREVWLFFGGGQHANHWVDISATIEQKIQALESHASQLGEWATSGGLRQEMLKWAAETATKHNLGYQYAEAFQRIVLVQDDPRPTEAAALEESTSP
jgi:LmbE family N-acetylglucosaminyl deacetylase